MLHGQRWHQNANGQTVMDQPDPGVATADKATTTLAAVATPVNGYVLATLNKRGEGTKEYVEAATWHVVRRDVISAAGTTTYTYDDFRTSAGTTGAWHWTSSDGHPENDNEERVESDDAGPVVEAELAIPSSRRELVEFPAGKTSVSVPLRADRDKFFVRVNVGSRGLDLLLDTGASAIVLDDDIVGQLGLTTYGAYSNAANAGRYKSTSAIVPEMKIGDLSLHDVVVRTVPHVGVDREGLYRAVGLLGFDFVAAVVLKMDYEHGQVTAIAPSSFSAPAERGTDALFVRLGHGVPMTDVKVNGALGERFMVDTGAGRGLFVFDYFARRHPEALVDTSGGMLQTGHFVGAGGPFETRRYKLASVLIGNVNFKDFFADVIATPGAYGGDGDGLIGTDLLKFYTLYTDYENSMIYLVPNSLGRAGFAP
jgi:predicted aspartyl protease